MKWQYISKWIIGIVLFILPFHALMVTYLKCKIGFDITIIRFWKELFVLIFLSGAFFIALKKAHWRLFGIFEGNSLVGLTSVTILCTFIYIFFPYFQLKPASLLGFRYDAFFLFCLLIGFYLTVFKTQREFFLKSIFLSGAVIMMIFLPWYLSGNIAEKSEILGYSTKVSTYNANECLAFSQNVDGHHRLQATFGGPIRFSVFLVIFYLLYLGWILEKTIKHKIVKYSILIIPTILVCVSIFYSYSKTSVLGIIFGLGLMAWLTNKFVLRRGIEKKYIIWGTSLLGMALITIAFIKRELFLHIGAMINRLENLSHSLEMFFYNPIGYGLGIAGPATQIGNSLESAGGWEISTANPTNVSRFLPENWFVQIFLEQGIIGGFLFLSLMIVIGFYLYDIVRRKKDFFSIALFSSFCSLNFMALFTHSFEEAATSYTLFLIIGGYIAQYAHFKNSPQKKK